jgi:hypothetical protein
VHDKGRKLHRCLGRLRPHRQQEVPQICPFLATSVDVILSSSRYKRWTFSASSGVRSIDVIIRWRRSEKGRSCTSNGGPCLGIWRGINSTKCWSILSILPQQVTNSFPQTQHALKTALNLKLSNQLGIFISIIRGVVLIFVLAMVNDQTCDQPLQAWAVVHLILELSKRCCFNRALY